MYEKIWRKIYVGDEEYARLRGQELIGVDKSLGKCFLLLNRGSHFPYYCKGFSFDQENNVH